MSVSRYEAIYSGFAIVIVAMIWLYLSWLILLLGAQLAFYLQNPEYLRLGQRTRAMSNALRERLALSTMLLVGRDFEKPGHGWRVESLAARIRVPRHLLEPSWMALTDAGLLTQDGRAATDAGARSRAASTSSRSDAWLPIRTAPSATGSRQCGRRRVERRSVAAVRRDDVERRDSAATHRRERTLADLVDADAAHELHRAELSVSRRPRASGRRRAPTPQRTVPRSSMSEPTA